MTEDEWIAQARKDRTLAGLAAGTLIVVPAIDDEGIPTLVGIMTPEGLQQGHGMKKCLQKRGYAIVKLN
jgi:hypothetical protein